MDGVRWLGHVVDSLVYMFSPVLACFLLRILQVSLPVLIIEFVNICCHNTLQAHHACNIQFAIQHQCCLLEDHDTDRTHAWTVRV